MDLSDFAEDVAYKSLPVLGAILLALAVERLRPAERQRPSSATFNVAYTFVYAIGFAALQLATAIFTVAAVNAAGGGLIPLADQGWLLLPSFLFYLLTLDLLEYLFHRAQHRYAWLWAMHSLHHSDPAMNASTTERHFWLEPGLKLLTIYLLAGLLFKTPPVILGMYALLGFYNIVPHMNLRLGFGRWWFLLNSPQYHRIHHSARPEHYNCNYAALFPFWDRIFGTYRVPQPDEYPPTGLGPDETPNHFAEALLWPLRRLWRRRAKQRQSVG